MLSSCIAGSTSGPCYTSFRPLLLVTKDLAVGATLPSRSRTFELVLMTKKCLIDRGIFRYAITPSLVSAVADYKTGLMKTSQKA